MQAIEITLQEGAEPTVCLLTDAELATLTDDDGYPHDATWSWDDADMVVLDFTGDYGWWL